METPLKGNPENKAPKMLRKRERFKQNPLRVLVTKRIFDEVTDPQPKAL